MSNKIESESLNPHLPHGDNLVLRCEMRCLGRSRDFASWGIWSVAYGVVVVAQLRTGEPGPSPSDRGQLTRTSGGVAASIAGRIPSSPVPSGVVEFVVDQQLVHRQRPALVR